MSMIRMISESAHFGAKPATTPMRMPKKAPIPTTTTPMKNE